MTRVARICFRAATISLACVLGCNSNNPTKVPTAPQSQAYVDATAAGERWSVTRSGGAFVIDHPGRFSFSIPTAEAQADGWTIVEASPARVRFTSKGQPSSLTVYADGRAYCDGEYKSMNAAMTDAGALAASHQSPAEISVPQLLGRVDRSSPGDANNDGYNESSGSYEVVAFGPRIEVTLAPRTAVLSRPVIEIAQLPGGTVLATLEGQLISSPVRLANGNVLIELPARLQRAAVVNVRVE